MDIPWYNYKLTKENRDKAIEIIRKRLQLMK